MRSEKFTEQESEALEAAGFVTAHDKESAVIGSGDISIDVIRPPHRQDFEWVNRANQSGS
jgi:hypothetical protein